MKVMKARVLNVIWNKKDTEVQVMQDKYSSREKGITNFEILNLGVLIDLSEMRPQFYNFPGSQNVGSKLS